MKKYLILLLVIVNLGLGVQGFSAMTKEEKTKLEKQIDDAYEKKDNKKMVTLIIKYVNEFPNNADYLNRLGVLYTNQKNYSEAEKWYLKVTKFEKDGFSENKLGLMFEEEGNQKEALKWYQASVQKGYPWAYYNLTNFYAGLGDSETAEKWLKKGMEVAKKTDDEELKKYFKEALDVIQKSK